MYCSLPGFSVHRISQVSILEWVALSFSRGSSQPRDGTHISCIAGGFFTTGSVVVKIKGGCLPAVLRTMPDRQY